MARINRLPPVFHSEETGSPFQNCADCGRELRQCDDGYLVQKAVHRGETIMEIAICSDCHEKLKNGYSEESRNAIWNFYLDHADLANREQRFATLPADDPSPWIASCATCGTPRHDAEDYTIGAECRGRQLVYGINPMMICGSCLEQIFNRLSQASRDNYNRWFDRCFPPDPTASNDTPSRNLLV